MKKYLVFVVVVLLALSTAAHAQDWIPRKGTVKPRYGVPDQAADTLMVNDASIDLASVQYKQRTSPELNVVSDVPKAAHAERPSYRFTKTWEYLPSAYAHFCLEGGTLTPTQLQRIISSWEYYVHMRLAPLDGDTVLFLELIIFLDTYDTTVTQRVKVDCAAVGCRDIHSSGAYMLFLSCPVCALPRLDEMSEIKTIYPSKSADLIPPEQPFELK